MFTVKTMKKTANPIKVITPRYIGRLKARNLLGRCPEDTKDGMKAWAVRNVKANVTITKK